MKHLSRRAVITITAAAALAGGVALAPALATPSSGVSTTILANKVPFAAMDIKAHSVPADTWQARLKTLGLTDAYVVDNVLAPPGPAAPGGGTTGWHSHPGPSLIFVIKGSVTNYDSSTPGCVGHTYTAPIGFIDEGGTDVHQLVNQGTVPAETIAVQLLPEGAVRKIDADPPANCVH